MNEMFSNAKANLLYWKMLYLKAFLTVGIAMATAITSVLSTTDWESLTGSQKFLVGLNCFIHAANTIIALMDKTLANKSLGWSAQVAAVREARQAAADTGP